MKKAKLLLCGICVGSSLLTGCASIVDGTHQTISVQTTPVNGALCSLQNNKGKWFVNKTPGSVMIHKSFNNLHVECSKDGYPTSALDVKSHVKAMLAGNILIGGGIGAGVDTVDGAAYQYPNLVTVPMSKNVNTHSKHKKTHKHR